jgi:rhamnogalacturonan endolyase
MDLSLYTSSWTLPAHAPFGYLDIPLDPPVLEEETGRGAYNANDATMADLDGDGQLEIVLKWDLLTKQEVSLS